MAFQRCYKAGGGSIPSFHWNIASPLYTQYKKNDTATSTYTASESCRVLVFNSEVIDEAGSGHSTEANITTTGTVIKTVLNQTTFDSGRKIRDSETRLSLIDLEANDTVTISNSSRTTYVNKTHIIWEADGIEDISESSYYDAIVDSDRDTTKLYSISNGIYLLLAQEVSGANVECTASITGSGILSGYSNVATNNSIAVAVASGTSIETLSTRSSNNYVSTIYGAWRITGTGQMPNITPSNSNPAELTANTPVNPLANGYAVASITNVTPSNSSPVTLTSGDIVKLGGNGKAVASVTNVTPSNSSPVSLTNGDVVKLGGNGKAVASITNVIPSNEQPSNVSAGDIIKITENDGLLIGYVISIRPSNSSPNEIISGNFYAANGNGKAVASITDVTPSNSPRSVAQDDVVKFDDAGVVVDYLRYVTPSNTVLPSLDRYDNCRITTDGVAVESVVDKMPSDSSPAAVASNSIIRPKAAGYLVSTGYKVKTGTATLSTSTTTTINLGFKPKYINMSVYKDSTHFTNSTYNENVTTSYTIRGSRNGSATAAALINLPTTSSSGTPGKILSISNTGFTVDVATSVAGTTAKYFAIG